MASLIYHLRRKIVTFLCGRESAAASPLSLSTGFAVGSTFSLAANSMTRRCFVGHQVLAELGVLKLTEGFLTSALTKVGRYWGTVVVNVKCGTYVLQRNSTEGGCLLSLSCRNSFRMIFERGFFFCKFASSHSAFSCNPSLAYNTPSARCDEYL